jgi:hypothetical protein
VMVFVVALLIVRGDTVCLVSFHLTFYMSNASTDATYL